MKHTPNLMKATVCTKRNEYQVVVDKYAGNRYIVIEGPDFLIGKEYRYNHGLYDRRKLDENSK